jgi:hypothetical protein
MTLVKVAQVTASHSAPNLRKGHAELLCDFSGAGPVVHLAHANGFPPGSYHLLADALIERYRVIALPSRALWPGSRPESLRATSSSPARGASRRWSVPPRRERRFKPFSVYSDALAKMTDSDVQ